MEHPHSRLVLANWILMLTVVVLGSGLLWTVRGKQRLDASVVTPETLVSLPSDHPADEFDTEESGAGETGGEQPDVDALESESRDEAKLSEEKLAASRREIAEEESATIALFKVAQPSVVHITTHRVQRDFFTLNTLKIPRGSGTGFVWDKTGHIVTNYHVIRDADVAYVAFGDHDSSPAKLVGAAPEKDLAVLKIDVDPDKLQPLPLGTSGDLEVGLKALAIGNPFGLDHTLTTGIVSALGREIESTTGLPIKDVIQTDAAINPGNSGGPLLDSSGRMIGVNTAIFSPSGTYAGIGFAIPVDVVKWVVPELIAHGKVIRPAIAVGLASDRMIAQLRLPGVLILDVKPNSKASLAEFRPTRRTSYGEILLGDIIISIDGKRIQDNKDLILTLEAYKVGDEVSVTVWREGKEVDVNVELEVAE